jgi:hypothetical protein
MECLLARRATMESDPAALLAKCEKERITVIVGLRD